MGKILFFYEQVGFRLQDKEKVTGWIKRSILFHNKQVGDINYIFCTDEHLLDINIQHLGHDTYTDIITFDQSERPDTISGDIFISIERVKENAATYSVSFSDELHRVMAHGILHLMGQSDKTDEQQAIMREEENKLLEMRDF